MRYKSQISCSYRWTISDYKVRLSTLLISPDRIRIGNRQKGRKREEKRGKGKEKRREGEVVGASAQHDCRDDAELA